MLKKSILLIAFSFVMPLAASAAEGVTFENYLRLFNYQERKEMKIGIAEMLQLYKQGKAQIIDVRFPEEHQAYSFSFIRSIPLNEIPERLGELDKSKIIITTCPHYDRAEIARTYLTLQGYQSRYLTDGLLGLAEYLRGDKARDFIREKKHDR